MAEYQDRPYTQLGFILNLEEHWFTLRRFGPAEPDLSADPGIGHWFNLNSCVDRVEWVSRTYLGMVLQQAEAEGPNPFSYVGRRIEGPSRVLRLCSNPDRSPSSASIAAYQG
jgi:ataxin-3